MDELLITIMQAADTPITVGILVWLMWDERRAHRAERDRWNKETEELIDTLFGRINGVTRSNDQRDTGQDAAH